MAASNSKPSKPSKALTPQQASKVVSSKAGVPVPPAYCALYARVLQPGTPTVQALQGVPTRTLAQYASGSAKLPRALRAQCKPHYSAAIAKAAGTPKGKVHGAVWLRGIVAYWHYVGRKATA